MKADPFAQLRLLDLQALDTALDQLAHKRRTLPEIAEMTWLDPPVADRRDDVPLAYSYAAANTLTSDTGYSDFRPDRSGSEQRDDRTTTKRMQRVQHDNATTSQRGRAS